MIPGYGGWGGQLPDRSPFHLGKEEGGGDADCFGIGQTPRFRPQDCLVPAVMLLYCFTFLISLTLEIGQTVASSWHLYRTAQENNNRGTGVGGGQLLPLVTSKLCFHHSQPHIFQLLLELLFFSRTLEVYSFAFHASVYLLGSRPLGVVGEGSRGERRGLRSPQSCTS